jgi:hypothetical protein
MRRIYTVTEGRAFYTYGMEFASYKTGKASRILKMTVSLHEYNFI